MSISDIVSTLVAILKDIVTVLKDMVIIINENSGLIQALSTVILVIVTIVYVTTTARMAKSSRDSVDEMRKQTADNKAIVDIMSKEYEATNRPFIGIKKCDYLPESSSHTLPTLAMEFFNTGRVIARNIEMKITGTFGEKVLSLEDPIPDYACLVPNEVLPKQFHLTSEQGKDILEKNKKLILEIEMNYSDLYGEKSYFMKVKVVVYRGGLIVKKTEAN